MPVVSSADFAQLDERPVRRPGTFRGPVPHGGRAGAREAKASQQRGVTGHDVGGTVGHDSPTVHQHDAPGHARGLGETVLDEHDRHVVPPIQSGQGLQHLPCAWTVEAGQWLVQHQQRWP